MTGPPYPLPLPPGSNAIGSFVIGISPIGSIPAFDVWTTIISQYANSPILAQMLVNYALYLDQSANMDAFYDDVWNIASAQGYGLDVWGRILGVTRVLQVEVGSYFGFSGPSGHSGDSFNAESFFSGETLTSNFSLADPAFQTLLYAKALANISNGSIPSINQILLALFPGRGNAYATDGLNMTMTYTFSFGLSAVELSIVGQSGALPKPAGVIATVITP